MKWTVIRSLGNLKILTKVSYFFLVFVPILASIWFIIPQILNNNSSKISKLANDLKGSEISDTLLNNKILTLGDSLSYYDLEQELNNTKKEIKTELDNIKTPKFNSQNLPLIWVFSYFAALFFLIGHLLYESFAPYIVREYQYNELLKNRKLDFLSAPNSELIEGYKLDLEEIKKQNEISSLGFRPTDPTLGEEWDLNIIEISTENVYNHNNKKNSVASFFSFIFFLLSIISLFLVLINQTINVLKSAGIINWS